MSNDTLTTIEWTQAAKDQIQDLMQEVIELECAAAIEGGIGCLNAKDFNEKFSGNNQVLLRASKFADLPYPKALEE